eukprot:GHRR01012193.1.p1 GENE.GHRR01012193.1~~GHRR01012193.1.p1  ORF type:complete len:326 (+),score=95.11 GHRR01012193.1:278-1255(+)
MSQRLPNSIVGMSSQARSALHCRTKQKSPIKLWHHTVSEALYAEGLSRVAESSSFEDGSRMIVVSWMVEVAEEFGLQQETLHAAVSLLDSFLSTSNGVPRCVLQLVAVGCIFMACKTLEVHHPTVEQMVAVAAHSFTAGDLLRVERVLLDTLEFNPTTHTPYGFLHLLTQATLAATSNPSRCNQPAASAAIALVTGQDQPSVSGLYATEPAMEVVVSLAMYLTELALLDPSCLACPGSRLATAALLLAHTTLSGHCGAWPMMLTAAGLTQADVSPALAALQRLHMVTTAPASPQLAELLMPFKAKFSQDCWCRVAVDVTPWHHRL